MRLATHIWLAALRKREEQRGAFFTVIKADERQAGAVFIFHSKSPGRFDIFAPAPQSLQLEGLDNRLFDKVAADVDQESIDIFLDRQCRFDPDLWAVEIELYNQELTLEVIAEQ